MKMKEKKTEEVVEEVVETPKISNELREYLEFVRFCVHQVGEFDEFHKSCTKGQDMVLEHLGLDISKPVSIVTGFSKESILEEYEKFLQNWIDRFNELDLTKIDNYTVARLQMLTPNIPELFLRKKLKKCAQHTTEE